jgi:thiol-disulfide isomerase/thioredoxin
MLLVAASNVLRQMKQNRKLLGLGLVLSVVLSASPTAALQKRTSKKAQPKISVAVIDAAGLLDVIKRDATKNKPLLVNFWATWCDPCREEFPDLVRIEKQYRPQGLDFTAVSLDDLSEIKTSVPQFLRQMQVTVPTYLLNVSDPDVAIHQVDPAWSGALPATFLYDSQGKLVYKRLGRIKLPELTAEIEKLLKGSQVSGIR